MAIVDSSSTCSFNTIQTIDLHHLSQSELHSLSLCSDAALNVHFSQDDVVIPKIDRNVFNESAGSRKQAYSRFRLAPSSSSSSSTTTASIRRRTPHLRNSRPPPETLIDDDPERAENTRIIHLLKELFAQESNGNEFHQIPVDQSKPVPVPAPEMELSNEIGNSNKKKRGRPRKDRKVRNDKYAIVPVPLKVERGLDVVKDIFYNENVEERETDVAKDRDIVNKNGAFVDLVALGGLSDPYGPELRRRTAGMETAEELLGFLSGLNGQWGSRRKKRMVVDANDFGNVLPSNWKLLLALKRKEGNVWLICRRYISPTGRQFASCKDISSYLLSICGTQHMQQTDCGEGKEIVAYGNETKDAADLSIKEKSEQENLVSPSLSPSTSGNGSNTNDVKITEAPPPLNEGQSVEPVLPIIVPEPEPLIQEPIEIETNSADIPDESLYNEEPSTDKFDHDLNCLPPDKYDFSQGNENVKMSAQESSDKDNYCDMSIDDMCVVDDEALGDLPIAIENSETIVSDDRVQETVCEDMVFTCSKEQYNGIDDLNDVTVTLPADTQITDMVKCVDENNLFRLSTNSSAGPKVDEIFNFESNECGSYGGSDIDAMTTLEEEKSFINFGNEISLQRPPVAEESDSGLNSETGFHNGPVISSWNDQEPVIRNYGNDLPTQQKKAETNMISSLFDYEQSCSVEDYVVPSKFDEKEKNLFRSLVPSGIEQSFGGISDNNQELSLAFGDPRGVKYAAVEDPKQARGSVGGLFNLLNDGFEDNLQSVYEVGNSGSSHSASHNNNNNKFMMNFGSSEYVQPDNGVWRTSQGNIIQSGLAGMPNPLQPLQRLQPLPQPSNSFCTFDLLPDKAQVYNPGYGGMRPNRSEPVEFSFLMAQNQNTNPLQIQNHININNNNTHNPFHKPTMERQFDLPFWLGRDALMPNLGGSGSSNIRRDQISAICQWCRTPYLQEPVLFGAQSAIGPVCPTCRAKFSGSI